MRLILVELSVNQARSKPQNFLCTLQPQNIINQQHLHLHLAIMATLSVGIIGMGDMGKMYARRLSEAGWK